MNRLKTLNKIHGLEASILAYNAFYNKDLLRCPIEEFEEIISGITINDLIRFRNQHEMNLVDLMHIRYA